MDFKTRAVSHNDLPPPGSRRPSRSKPPAAARPTLLARWYRLTAPKEPAEHASFAQRELFRRGRLASILLLAMLGTIIAFIPLALTSVHQRILPIVLALLLVCLLAMVFNRAGKVTLVAILIVGSVNVALILSFLTAANMTLSTSFLPIFDLFVLSELVAVSLLAPESVFLVALFNSLFIIFDILYQPHTADLGHLLALSSYTLIIRPVALQGTVALVTYLWVRSAQQAHERANEAEVIAALEHTIAEQKRDLDADIQQLLLTLVQAANGDLSVRAPIVQEHVLWQVATGLNTLLARLQRASKAEYELQRVQTELTWLVGQVREAKARRVPLRAIPRGSLIDPLLRELCG